MRTPKLLALVFAATALPAAAEEFGRFPTDWFVLPEDAQSYESDTKSYAKEGYGRSEEAAADSVDKILYYSAQAMQDNDSTIGSRERPADAPADWVPWHLSEMYMDLGINAAGTAGLVTAIGEASVEIRWAQSQARKAKLGLIAAQPQKVENADASADDSDRPADLTLNEHTSKQEVEYEVERVADAVMATGRVSDRPLMREGLLKVATDLQALMININSYNDSYWDIAKFGLDVEISGSGKVGTGWTIGGALRLRFEWKRAAAYDSERPEPQDGETDRREDLRKLLAGIAKDMDGVGRELYADSGFDLTNLRLGIGLYASAKFGVVKGKIGVTGYAHFAMSKARANAHYRNDKVIIVPSNEIPLIDDEPKAAHKTYAAANSIRFQEVPGGENAEDRVIYFMTRDKFQKGVKMATKMGAWFANRAKKRTGEGADYDQWYVNQVKPQFALGLEGAIKVVTIGGKVSLELTFKRS